MFALVRCISKWIMWSMAFLFLWWGYVSSSLAQTQYTDSSATPHHFEITPASIKIATTWDPSDLKPILKRNDYFASLDLVDYEIILYLQKKLQIKFEIITYPTVATALGALRNGEVDFAMGTFVISPKRMTSGMQFTQPYGVTSMGVIGHQKKTSLLKTISDALFSPNVINTLILLLLLSIFFGHIIWWLEKDKSWHHNTISQHYFPGVLQGIWFSFNINNRLNPGTPLLHNCHWIIKFLAIPIWLTGVLLVAVTVAQLSFQFSRDTAQPAVLSIQDLKFNTVYVLEGAHPADLAKKFQLKDVIAKPTYDEVMDAFFNDKTSYAIIGHDNFSAIERSLPPQRLSDVQFVIDDLEHTLVGIAIHEKYFFEHPQLVADINKLIVTIFNNDEIPGLRDYYLNGAATH